VKFTKRITTESNNLVASKKKFREYDQGIEYIRLLSILYDKQSLCKQYEYKTIGIIIHGIYGQQAVRSVV
jgi:hypothetical protein